MIRRDRSLPVLTARVSVTSPVTDTMVRTRAKRTAPRRGILVHIVGAGRSLDSSRERKLSNIELAAPLYSTLL
jgi:hypothetical protein